MMTLEDLCEEPDIGCDFNTSGTDSDESTESADELLGNDEHEGMKTTTESAEELLGNDEHEVMKTTTEATENSPQDTGVPDKRKRSEEKEVRGLTRMLKLTKKWDGKKHVVEFDGFGRFKGEYASEIASYMGVLVRRDVGLRHLKWKEVPSELKERLWLQILRFYEIEDTMKKRMLCHLGEHLRNFRRKLYVKFIRPNLLKPSKLKVVPRKYRVFLKQEHWDKFVVWRLSPECKKMSDYGAAARENHKYEHRMGRTGYSGLVEKLIKEKVIREDDDPSRSLLWRKARQNKNGEYSDDDVREKAAQLEEFDKKLEDGTLVPEPGTDSLTHVFGKERSGRVKCAGKGVTPTNYWHLPRRGASKESIAELKQQLDNERQANQREKELKDEQMKDMMEKLAAQAKMMSTLMSQLNSQGLLKKKASKTTKSRRSTEPHHSAPPAHVSPTSSQHSNESRPMSSSHESPIRHQSRTERHESDATKTISSTQSPDSLRESQSMASKDKSQHMEFSHPTGKCKLCCFALRNVVAIGTIYPSSPDQTVHGEKLGEDCVKVSIEEALDPNQCLPIETKDLKTVHDAVNSFVAWPKTLVILWSTMEPLADPDPDPEPEPESKKKKKKKKASDLTDGGLNPSRINKRVRIAA